jgi:hypothetical protein
VTRPLSKSIQNYEKEITAHQQRDHQLFGDTRDEERWVGVVAARAVLQEHPQRPVEGRNGAALNLRNMAWVLSSRRFQWCSHQGGSNGGLPVEIGPLERQFGPPVLSVCV